MRTITRQAVEAFMNDIPLRASNTRVSVGGVYTRLYLHGNEIAWKKCNKDKDKSIRITNANWKTNVTKERLNGIPGVHIVQKDSIWYLNGTPWDGSWITI